MSEYIDYIKEKLEPFNFSFKKMFGGHCIKFKEKAIGIIIDGTLFFKCPKERSLIYKEIDNSYQFSYIKKDQKEIKLSYWSVPDEILEDEELLKNTVKLVIACL